jgi:PCI domain
MQVAAFGKQLKPHQMASLPDGTTVLEAAVVEHNLAAAARLYNNIYLSELGTLLGVDGAKAEEIASKMITESRLKVRVASGAPGTPSTTVAEESTLAAKQHWHCTMNNLRCRLSSSCDAMHAGHHRPGRWADRL